jgi:alkanesulfonate monooxygenase SsuD/methylene tetrahydromethanopterin reductase-like flavin-dependent oxidoreductase (luciferase family)
MRGGDFGRSIDDVTERSEAAGEAGLHVGVTPWMEDWNGPAESLARQAELAEQLGFRSFWLPESHFTGPTANPAPLLGLAAVAARTSRLRLATTSYLLPVRHPLHVAAEVAALDQLSGGRVILGVGRGFRPALFRAFGVPAQEKRDRFEAALEVILAAWRGEPVVAPEAAASAERAQRAEGERTRPLPRLRLGAAALPPPGPASAEARPVVLAPLPVQKPHPPVWVAGFGPKGVSQAGRLGLPYLASPLETLGALEENYARHREALSPQRRAGPLAVPVMRTIFTSRDGSTLARVRAALARQAAALSSAPVASLRRQAGAKVERWALVGEPEEVAEGVRRYREKLGMSHLIVRAHVPGAEPADLAASLELLAGLDL